jgi:H+/Cl- antiporter ClcA
LAFANGSSAARVGYQVENTGNTILRGRVHVWVTNLFGQTVKTFPSNVLGNLLPSQEANFVEPLWKSLPIAGPQTVHVTFSAVGAKTASGTSTFWVIPWVLIIVIAVLLLALAAWLWRRHRRKVAGGGTASDKDATRTSEKVGEAAPKEPVPTA